MVFQICLFQYAGPLCIMTAPQRVFAVRIHKALNFGHRSTMTALSMFLTSTKILEGILNYSFQNKSTDDKTKCKFLVIKVASREGSDEAA